MDREREPKGTPSGGRFARESRQDMERDLTEEGFDDIANNTPSVSSGTHDMGMNAIYALTDHTHTEEELAPWFQTVRTGDAITDGLILTAFDCAWGNWRKAVDVDGQRLFSNPEYAKAVGEQPWRWDFALPAGLFDRGLDTAQWSRLVAALNDLGRFGLSDTAIIRRDLRPPFAEHVAGLWDGEWERAGMEADERTSQNLDSNCEYVACDLRVLAEKMDGNPQHANGLVRYETRHALAGFDYLTFKETR